MPSGTTLCVFQAEDNRPPTSNYATLDTRNAHRVLDFDASTDETANFEGVLPRNYTSLGITARLAWMSSAATSGNVVWTGRFERQDDEGTDLDADSFASAVSATAAAPSTNGYVQYTDIAFTNSQIDSLAAGERFRFQVSRDADHASDTMSGDAELLGVELRET